MKKSIKLLLVILFIFPCQIIAQQADLPKNPKPGICYERNFNLNEKYQWKEIDCDKAKKQDKVLTEDVKIKAKKYSNKIKKYQTELQSAGYKVNVNGKLDKITIASHHKYLKEKEKHFEGQITYEIEYTPYNNDFSAERIKALIGSRLVLTFKKGNYKKEYFSPNGELLQERFLILKDKKNYQRTSTSDTIYWIDITKYASKTVFTVLKDSTFLNHPCTIVETESIVTIDGFNREPQKVGGIFKYAKDLSINPKWYKNYKEGNFNNIVKSAPGIAIQSINKGVYWEQTITMISITRRKVLKSELNIDLKDVPLKKL